MAIVVSYPLAQPKLDDLLLGTEVYDVVTNLPIEGSRTRNFTLTSIANLITPLVPGGGTVTSVIPQANGIDGTDITQTGYINLIGGGGVTTSISGDTITINAAPASITAVTSQAAGTASTLTATPTGTITDVALTFNGANTDFIDGAGNYIALNTLPQGEVTSIVAGSHIAVSPITGVGDVTVTSTPGTLQEVTDQGSTTTETIVANKFTSTQATGVAPLTIASTTLVPNLYVDRAVLADTATTVITNADLTGMVTSSGNATTVVTNADLAGMVTSSGNTTTVVTNADLSGMVTSSGNTTTVVTNADLTGEVTSSGNATVVPNATVINKVLTGYTSGAGTVLATDNILQAIEKLDGNASTNADLTGMVTSVGNATTVVTNADLTGGVTSTGNATTVITNANLTGEVTSVGNATLVPNATVIDKVLTGYVSGAGAITATDNILEAIQKLDGNSETNSNLTGMVTSVGNETTVVTNANLTGGVTSSGNAATVITNANLTGGVTSVGNAATVITNANLSGEVTSIGNVTTVVTNADLTGDVTSVGNATTVVTNADLTGDVTSVGNATTVVTNADLTGVIESVGNATSIASQTGTGTKFVVDTSPTLVTPNIGAASGDSLSITNNISGGTGSFTGQVTIPAVPVANTDAASMQYVDSKTTGALIYIGVWNASTNSPALASGTGTVGNYYIVSVAGTTNLDGITDWAVGDWAVFSDLPTDAWQKIDNTSVLSGTGTGGKISKWSGSGTSVTLGDSVMTETSGDISIAGDVSADNLSGTNTGDQDLSGKVTKNADIAGDTKTKITYDAKGLVTAGEDATTSDISEGTNLYYTEARVDANGDVAANTAKATNVTTNLATTKTATTVTITSSDGTDAEIPSADATNAGILTKALYDNIIANNAKVTNVSTDLGITGTTDARVITSSDGDNAEIPVATTSVSGVMSTTIFDEHVANNAKVTNGGTNLSEGTSTTTTVDVNSSDGDNATLVSASTTRAGVLTTAKWDEIVVNNSKISFDAVSSTRLANTSGTNTGDQDVSGFVVKNADITGGTKTKITYDAKGLVTAGDDATTADIAASTNKNYVTDAEATVIGNTSNTNTGDQTLSGLGGVAANTAITGAVNTKITYDAKGLVTAGASATTADIAATTDKNYVTDAEAVVIGNTSNTNTGDQTIINQLPGGYLPLAGGVLTGYLTGTNAQFSSPQGTININHYFAGNGGTDKYTSGNDGVIGYIGTGSHLLSPVVNDNDFVIRAQGEFAVSIAASEKMRINSSGAIKFNEYDSTNNIGTPTYLLGTDSAGNIVKTSTNIGERAYTLPSTAGAGAWKLLGRFTASHGGKSIFIKMVTNVGYNSSVDQNLEIYIRFKTSNGGSVDGNGFSGDSSFYTIGANDGYPYGDIKWVANAAGTSATSYDLYVKMGAYSGDGGFYTVEQTTGTWTPLNNAATDPGAGSSTVMYSLKQFKVGTASTFSSGVTSNILTVADGFEAYGANSIAASGQSGNYVASFGKSQQGSAYFVGNITVGSGNSSFSGNVLIGATTNTAKLNVGGKIKADDDLILAQTNGRIDFDNGVNSGALRFWSTSGNAERMRIASGGNVVIGSTSINGSFGASNTVFAVVGSTSGGEGIIQIIGKGNNATDNVGKLTFHSYAESDPMCSISSIRGSGDDVGVLAFSTNNGGTVAERMRINSGGNISIDNTNNSYKLDVSGTIRATGDVIAYSDARVKENVETIENALDKVTKLRGVSYTRNDIEDKSTKIGVIAQEILEVVPEVVQQDNEGKYSVSYGNIVGLLIESIKELKAEVDELKSRI